MEIKHTYTVVDQSPKTEIRPVRRTKNLVTEGFWVLHAVFRLHSERFSLFMFHIIPKTAEGLKTTLD